MQSKTHDRALAQQALVILARQSQFYKVYKYTPQLLSVLNEQADEVLDAFLGWANRQLLAMDWTLHLHLLNWLDKQAGWHFCLSEDVKIELLKASVTRWSLMGLEHVHAKGLMLFSKLVPGKAIGLWKSTDAERAAKLQVLSLSENVQPSGDAFAVADTEGSWDGVIWQPLAALPELDTINN